MSAVNLSAAPDPPTPARMPGTVLAAAIALWALLGYGCFAGMYATLTRVSVISVRTEAAWMELPPYFGKLTLFGAALTLVASVLRLVFVLNIRAGSRRMKIGAMVTEFVWAAYWLVTINLPMSMPSGIADYTGVENGEALVIPAICLSALVIVLLGIEQPGPGAPTAGSPRPDARSAD